MAYTSQNSDPKISQLLKEVQNINCKRKDYTILNCLEKAKVSTIMVILDIDDIENINIKKEA